MRGLMVGVVLAAMAAAPGAFAQSDTQGLPSNFVTADTPQRPTPESQRLYGKPTLIAPDTADVGLGWQDDHRAVVLGYDQRDRDASPDPALDAGPQYPGQAPQDDSGVVGLSFSMRP